MRVLSCGHHVEDYRKVRSVCTKEYTREGNRAVSYKTICVDCYREYLISGQVFESEQEALEWLKEES